MRQIGDYCLNVEVTGKRLCAANLLQKQFVLEEEHYSFFGKIFPLKRGVLDYVRNNSLSSYNIGSHSVDMLSTVPTALHDLRIKCNTQGGSNMTGTDLCVNKPHCAAAVRP